MSHWCLYYFMEGCREGGARVFTVCTAKGGEITDTNCIKEILTNEQKKIFAVRVVKHCSR